MSLNDSEYQLTFEWDKENETLEIHANKSGLQTLKQMIESLLAQNENDHVHLMSDEWGGKELSTQKQSEQNEIIHHVKIYNWS